jgi:hypothetical protein
VGVSTEKTSLWGHAAITIAAGVVAVLAASLMLGAAAAHGYATASGYTASDYASGFTVGPSRWGPIGMAFDQSDALYVGDPVDGALFRFPPGGGRASPATLVGYVGRGVEGLAVSGDGSLYAAEGTANDVVQFDPASARVVREVASGLDCPTGLAVDPVTGDLFASQNHCGNAIFRISNFRSGPGTVSTYASLPSVDGLAFNSDGTLYAESNGTIYSITGTASAAPGVATPIARVPSADGLAFGATTPGGRLPFLISNRLDGVVTKIDMTGPVPSTTDIFTGGSRGDFAAVDSHGCLYITQTDRIVRVAPTRGACNLQPTTFGSVASVPSQLALQCTRRRLTLIDVLRHGNHVALLGAADRSLAGRTVDIYFRVGERLVAQPTVGPDGFFSATAPLPSATIRATNLARYEARIGPERSLDLKLTRRMIVDSLTSRAGIVTVTGHIARPLSKPPAAVTFERRVSCTKWVDVSIVKPRADGTFSFSMPAPPHLQAAVYRAATLVRTNNHSRKLFATFTLPRVVALN